METISPIQAVLMHGVGTRCRCGLLLILAILITACSMKYTEEPIGSYRMIPWGSHPESIKGLEIIQEQETMVIARRSNEKLLMGEAMLEEIRYYFLNNALFQVDAYASGRTNLWHMKQEIEKNYGPPTSVNDQVSHYFWRMGDLAIHLNYYSMQDRVIAVYSNVRGANAEVVEE